MFELGQAGSGQQLRQNWAPKQLSDSPHSPSSTAKRFFKEPDYAFPAFSSKAVR